MIIDLGNYEKDGGRLQAAKGCAVTQKLRSQTIVFSTFMRENEVI